MSRTSTLILLGILTILAPFSGLPIAIRNFLAVIIGACVAGIGLMLRVREAHAVQPPTVESPSVPPPPSSISPI